MDPVLILQPSVGGLTLAAAAIVAGAPMFSSGVRATRLRGKLRRLGRYAVAEAPMGFAHVRGRVALESPLFSPLSAAPCAGFQLDVRAEGLKLQRTVDVRRAFRLEGGGVAAVVAAPRGRWLVSASAERVLAPGQPVSDGLAALLQRVPEAQWWRRAGGSLQLVERALPAGAECHVVGSVRPIRSSASVVEWARTGTDDLEVHAASGPRAEPDLWIGPDDHLDFLIVSDQPPGDDDLRVPRRHTAGVVVGPVLSMLGMLYLASVADYLRSLGRF
ncbi:MAG TPA: hypothetical protein VI792_02555 [Candidatus Eisenbacteria bacterium]